MGEREGRELYGKLMFLRLYFPAVTDFYLEFSD